MRTSEQLQEMDIEDLRTNFSSLMAEVVGQYGDDQPSSSALQSDGEEKEQEGGEDD